MTKRNSLILISAVAMAFAASAKAADLPSTKPPAAAPATSCFSSFLAYMNSSPEACPLSMYGITVYGTIDMGGSYDTHGVGFNRYNQIGDEAMISKNSQGSKFVLAPNALSQSTIGVKGAIPLFAQTSFVFDANVAFDPYSMELANGPKSIQNNNDRILQQQTANNDSAKAGQAFNNLFAGLKNDTFGTLTFGRQNTLTLDAVNKYDPMSSANNFSWIGFSGTTAGGGDTENTRTNTALKYRFDNNMFRVAGLYQVGGYAQGNAANEEYQAQAGASFYGFDFDAIYGHTKDSVGLAGWSSATAVATPIEMDSLKATLSNNTSIMAVGKYTWQQFQFFAGYEHIRYANPSDPYPDGFTSIADITVLPNSIAKGSVSATSYTINKILQVAWGGAKYSINANWDLIAAYDFSHQNDYSTTACTGSGIHTSSGSCAGNLHAVSGVVEWHPFKRLDVYAGVMYSKVTGGQASGYTHDNNVATTAGVRFRF
jgi:predicted porin